MERRFFRYSSFQSGKNGRVTKQKTLKTRKKPNLTAGPLVGTTTRTYTVTVSDDIHSIPSSILPAFTQQSKLVIGGFGNTRNHLQQMR